MQKQQKNQIQNPIFAAYERVCGINSPIHPTVIFGKNVRLGENVVIDEHSVIGNNVFIGHNTVIRNNVCIGSHSTIGHSVVIEGGVDIGAYSTIQSLCFVASHAIIGDHVFMAPKSMILNTKKICHGRNYKVDLLKTRIQSWARISAGAICMPGISVGRNAQLAAGSVATRDIPDKEIWTGTPAVYFKSVPEDEIV